MCCGDEGACADAAEAGPGQEQVEEVAVAAVHEGSLEAGPQDDGQAKRRKTSGARTPRAAEFRQARPVLLLHNTLL